MKLNRELLDDTILQHCLDSAYHYLSYRARSEFELKQHLLKRGFSNESVEKAIITLKEQSLIDDLAFARFWRDSRLSSNPRSKRLMALELRDKGVSPEIIERTLESTNDEEIAYASGCHRMHLLAHLEYPQFQQRLSNYLAYRGFSYEIIRTTIARLWQENQGKT